MRKRFRRISENPNIFISLPLSWSITQSMLIKTKKRLTPCPICRRIPTMYCPSHYWQPSLVFCICGLTILDWEANKTCERRLRKDWNNFALKNLKIIREERKRYKNVKKT
jgi:hypothetical protein